MTERKRTNKKPSESIYCFSPYGFNNTEIEHNSHRREREMLLSHEGRMKIINHPWRSKLSLTVKITNCSYKDIKLKGEGNESYEKKIILKLHVNLCVVNVMCRASRRVHQDH